MIARKNHYCSSEKQDINYIVSLMVQYLFYAFSVFLLIIRLFQTRKKDVTDFITFLPQLYNAHQLAEWCMSYLCVNYNIICKYSIKGLKALHQENQEYLREHRWPPVWYLKDFDIYQRCMNEMHKEMSNGRKRSCNDDNGCLCFSGGKSELSTLLFQRSSRYRQITINCIYREKK